MREAEAIQGQFNGLYDFVYERKITVTFKLFLTKVGGKVCNNLSETTSTLSCYICKAKQSELKDVTPFVNTIL